MATAPVGFLLFDHFAVPASGQPFYSSIVAVASYSQDISIQLYNTGSGTPNVYVLGSNFPTLADAWTDISSGGFTVAAQSTNWSGYMFKIPAGYCEAIKLAITTNGTGPIITAIASRGFIVGTAASASAPSVFSSGVQ